MKKFIWSYFGNFYFVCSWFLNEDNQWLLLEDFKEVKIFTDFNKGSQWASELCKELNYQFYKESE